MEAYLSVFDMFKIGVGPSSSHTLGPWIASLRFVEFLKQSGKLSDIVRIKVLLYGSLALTGKGHCTDIAVVMGLAGEDPEQVPIDAIAQTVQELKKTGAHRIGKVVGISFSIEGDIEFLRNETLPLHPNGMSFHAWNKVGDHIHKIYYSIGGGFVCEEDEMSLGQSGTNNEQPAKPSQLLAICERQGKAIWEIVLENEKKNLSQVEIQRKLSTIWAVMKAAAYEGCHTEGVLPGGLNVKRRAFELNKLLLRIHDYQDISGWMQAMCVGNDFDKVLKRVACIALATNEVNASMGRIVTAPTNGSAGVIPAVLFYYVCFCGHQVTDLEIGRFLLTAGEIGKYFKWGATISAAVGGCQAEIGVSSSMAAGALAERLGGTPAQVFMAAEIAAEHHLGLTCDPIAGLVQVPCIERNSMGAVKAITAAMMALSSDPQKAKVTLDQVIDTMRVTGANMHNHYKETSLGGLAIQVSVVNAEC